MRKKSYAHESRSARDILFLSSFRRETAAETTMTGVRALGKPAGGRGGRGNRGGESVYRRAPELASQRVGVMSDRRVERR